MTMSDDSGSEIERIGATVDANGDEVPQDHPIENPRANGDEETDPIDEPHPDEPGVPGDAGETAPAED